MAYGELDGRERDVAARKVLSGADFKRDERAGIAVWRQLGADVCWRAGRSERDFGRDAAGECDLSCGFADVWVSAGLAGELELTENTGPSTAQADSRCESACCARGDKSCL